MTATTVTDRLLSELALGMAADWRPLSARIERAGRGKAPTTEIERLIRAMAASRERVASRAARVPRIAYPPELPVSDAPRRNRRGDSPASGRDRLRRDRLGQDDAVAEDLPRDRARHCAASSATRSRGVSPREASRHASRRSWGRRWARRSVTRCASPIVRARRVRQADDRRHPARRNAERPATRGVRHDHRRRGARAQPQHRFPARLPQATDCASATISRSSSRRQRSTPSASRGTSAKPSSRRR